ncbi:hypothetical protein KIN20_029678 [Parelaphostrongylus tenuis]|uniref:Mitochondrial carrier protein n=1 Tax=Parelaphostrongylus tenuis TaxID=148309 RepID=A0AAD5R316_PARTN|nr:hypothetical protein KIN20_029678 [Parelaphostrongylus tenuis]
MSPWKGKKLVGSRQGTVLYTEQPLGEVRLSQGGMNPIYIETVLNDDTLFLCCCAVPDSIRYDNCEDPYEKKEHTILCLQYETSATKKYSGMLECLYKIFKEEGVRGLYKGFIPGLFGTTHGALQFMLYNRLKAWRCEMLGLTWDAPLNSQDYLVFSAVSKTIATTVHFPVSGFSEHECSVGIQIPIDSSPQKHKAIGVGQLLEECAMHSSIFSSV